MRFDVVIISKDRYPQLINQINRIKNRFPYNKIIVVDSTEIIPEKIKSFYKTENIEHYHTPKTTLGNARQIGLEVVSTPFFFMLDDDIVFDKGYAQKLYQKIINYNKTVFAVSPLIVFGDDKSIQKIYLDQLDRPDREGVSGGASIMDRRKLHEVGGFNSKIHIGEDSELRSRAALYGYRWIRTYNVVVYHPGDKTSFLFRKWKNRHGQLIPIAFGKRNYFGLLLVKLREITVNIFKIPLTGNIKTQFYYLAYNIISLIALIRAIIGGENYALYRKKIKTTI